MSSLTIEEKLNLVIDLTKKHHITAYEIGDNTELNASGIHRILTREVKKPRNKTLNIILEYIENKIVGSNLGYDKSINKDSVAKEDVQEYTTRRFEDVVAQKVTENLKNCFDRLYKSHQQSRDILEHNRLTLDKLMDDIEELKEITDRTYRKVSKD